MLEKTGTYKGFDFCITLHDGYRCGYVRLERNHKYFKKNYIDIPINCHEGLTSSKFFKSNEFNKDSQHYNYWWIGFDCNHGYDSADSFTSLMVEGECKHIIEQLKRKK